ncbi:MAG: hypothetical protein IRY88_09630 [Rubrobacteraceae bacterium]|nr:hypothetical protein [Rubrobacteraceae bacterium]
MEAAQRLRPQRLDVLIELAATLGRHVAVDVDPDSDLMTAEFVEDFSARLIAYHAFHEQKLTKKTFEFVFRGACRAAGRRAEITSSPVNPGADVTVDGVPFSLKTEGACSMSRDRITISKLMEARWIRECRTPEDFARETVTRVVDRLRSYRRILVLRAFSSGAQFEYHLVEIPLGVLMQVQHLTAADFSDRTNNGGSNAHVEIDGKIAFTLRLDGSVEKVTVSGLRLHFCRPHATWRVERLLR